ncbi:MAG: purine-nucleoside phosphorylase [Flavobacteriales bacterium]|jgi:purine-nucleoside phosphorylase|nr:purine-nucleoside phosphorylase [Flavobacteriales bacterium]NCG29756.1 purine-nucleoside phosphorylase [Bacteroidota bacterium]MBT3963239.1 purine-nucleoside phosphorylase [Flavobacteriales bacterium]MBT4704199.1 purine-nucleoside phosphorylase [Flavobacteriales bacterium]MBT4929981.1 purine-nucleoside phosphorylase [Flavobacteriales bacterium]
MKSWDDIRHTADLLGEKGFGKIDIIIILGSGLGRTIEQVDILHQLPYDQIAGFPHSTVSFHAGNLILAQIAGKRCAVLQGRSHFYEGHSMGDIAFPIRVLHSLGAKQLITSGAAGCMNLDWMKGDIMLLSDHINLLPTNPLIGPNDERIGTRFPDMSEAYSRSTNAMCRRLSAQLGFIVREGVYAAVTGPMLESPAEYRFLRTIGADAVGMSIIPEVIAAKHVGMTCTGLVVLTDVCDPSDLKPINIPDIISTATKADSKLAEIITHLIAAS